jgi:hypothetical protein
MPSPARRRSPRERRKLGPTQLRGRRDRVHLATRVMVALATFPPAPDAAGLAVALGWTPGELSPILGMMGRAGLVELLGDAARPDVARVLLSGASLAELGLRLSPRGDRWLADRQASPGAGGGFPGKYCSGGPQLSEDKGEGH